MNSIEIINSTPSKITIRSGEKTATIAGEALTRMPGQPDFIVYANSLRSWHAGAESTEISPSERTQLIEEVVKQLLDRGWKIEVE